MPIQITGPTSTPPMGGMNFLVKFKIELVGNVINNQKRRPVDQTSHFISLNKFQRYRINHANLELDHERYLQDRVKVLALLKSQ